MKQDYQDNGLRKVLGKTSHQLPSNFTFCTMRKIDKAIHRKEEKQERWMFYSILAISILLLLGGGIVIIHYYGEHIQRMFKDVTTSILKLTLPASPYILYCLAFFILMGFDFGIRKMYFKRH